MTEKDPSVSDFELIEIQKLKSDHENEIKNLKQSFQQLIDEKIKKNTEQIKSLEIKIQKKIDNEFSVLKQKDGESTSVMEEKNYLNLKFVKIANKWNKIISLTNCCENKCINTDKPIGKCIKGNGFINITNWENIKYIKCVEGEDKLAGANAENQFKKPEDDINYSMVYFEIKSKIEGEKSNNNWLSFGLCGSNNVIKMDIDDAYVLYKSHNKLKKFKLPTTFSWNDNDIFGFGLVYPPSNKMTELPYFFFTQNGKQIGKALLLNGNCDRYEVVIGLKLCSVETNFGSDLKTKPFIYDITKHSMPKEFYVFDAF